MRNEIDDLLFTRDMKDEIMRYEKIEFEATNLHMKVGLCFMLLFLCFIFYVLFISFGKLKMIPLETKQTPIFIC
ncbi:MAG: hypothetical protein Sylvanvirus8_3 [Sylvanvirus sp.]|uniref:Uncharacterized protein n=1 Tax=Sylvanvirus sp. TaxID=2487774 RepID=A0A3G5AHS1_9VIRU|nr:MAG: hypothetical protein Sylvanvirus8_3 [Sylvanvirus sp.]